MHAVVFDIDGTLLQSAGIDEVLYRSSVSSVLGPVRFRPSLIDYDYVTDSGILSQIFVDNSIDPHPDSETAIKARFVELLASHIRDRGPFPEVPGARTMLDSLQTSRTHAVAIATGGWQQSALLKLAASGFDLSHIPVATSDDAFDRKEIMQLALSRLGSKFRSITYYGDGPWDEAACIALGWRFVAVGANLGGIESYLDVEFV